MTFEIESDVIEEKLDEWIQVRTTVASFPGPRPSLGPGNEASTTASCELTPVTPLSGCVL